VTSKLTTDIDDAAAHSSSRVTRGEYLLTEMMRHATSSRHLGELLASSIEAGIHVEAVLSSLYEGQTRALTHVLGRSTKAERREREERVGLPSHQRPRSTRVFWEDGGNGRPLLLLNGWTASASVWPSGLLQRLEREFRLIRMDCRGGGWSRNAPAPFTIADLADDAAEVLHAAQACGAVVVGYSMGGMVAQELAIRHPSLISGLCLISTRPPAPDHILAGADALAAGVGRPEPGQDLREYLQELWGSYAAAGFAARRPDLIDELVTQLLARRTPRSGVMNQLRAISSWHGSERLAAITAPTIVIHGASDPLTPVGNGLRLARMIPGAEYVELADVGHLVLHEAEDQLIQRLAQFAVAVSE